MQKRELKSAVPIKERDVLKLRRDVEDILTHVKRQGDKALQHYARTFDKYDGPLLLENQDIDEVRSQLPEHIVRGLDFAIERVTAFAQAQRDQILDFEKEMLPGVFMGHRSVPVDSFGAYVPAGRYPCLTAAVMSLVPGKVAGVKRIVACSPPGTQQRINPAILYTMLAIGAHEIYCLGGAQAIAALAYGTETVKPVDLIVGPGNQYVAEAKRQVFGDVGIDFIAGPSECMVIADETGRADYIAADLLAQCEHDPNARGALVTISERLGKDVLEEIERQLKELETEAVARASWENNGIVVIVPSLEEAAIYANQYAPEHLEIHTRDPEAIFPLLNSYGSLFLGEDAAEVFADKIAGTNHTLPTGGAARYTGGLWVGKYLKTLTFQRIEKKESMRLLAEYAMKQSEFEKMDAHRRAALIRLKNKA